MVESNTPKKQPVQVIQGKNTYKLGKLIMKGGQAEVYMAKATVDDKSVYYAVKKFNRRVMELNVKRFQDMVKEIEALRGLNKNQTFDGVNNIIELVECISTTNSYYLVLSLCNGGDLREYMESRNGESPSLTVTQHVVLSLVRALIMMHEKFNLVHRDLKPENVLLHLEGANP